MHLRPVWSTYEVPGQRGLHRDTVQKEEAQIKLPFKWAETLVLQHRGAVSVMGLRCVLSDDILCFWVGGSEPSIHS